MNKTSCLSIVGIIALIALPFIAVIAIYKAITFALDTIAEAVMAIGGRVIEPVFKFLTGELRREKRLQIEYERELEQEAEQRIRQREEQERSWEKERLRLIKWEEAERLRQQEEERLRLIKWEEERPLREHQEALRKEHLRKWEEERTIRQHKEKLQKQREEQLRKQEELRQERLRKQEELQQEERLRLWKEEKQQKQYLAYERELDIQKRVSLQQQQAPSMQRIGHPDDIVITLASKVRIEEELLYIRTIKRPELNKAINHAREYGGLSKNFEYQAAKEAQAILDARVAELKAILKHAIIVQSDMDADRVGLGKIVLVYDIEEEEEWELMIVDFASADPYNDKISVSSPVGQALMGKVVGEVASAYTPNGLAQYKVLGIF